MSIFCKRCIIVVSLLFACISLSACGPSEEEKRRAEQQKLWQEATRPREPHERKPPPANDLPPTKPAPF